MNDEQRRHAIELENRMTLAVEGQIVEHDDFRNVMNAIEALHALGREKTTGLSRSGRGIALLGRAGAGKSLIIDEYLSRTQMIERPLAIKVPQNARAVQIVEMMLEELGDDCPRAGTVRDRETRCHKAIEEAGIGIIFFDEIHHFLSRSSNNDVNTRGGHWLKSFLDRCALPTVVVGTPEAGALLAMHPELKRRFKSIVNYEPFGWDDIRTRKQFLAFLLGLQKVLPLKCDGVLVDPGVAAELHRRTSGAPGLVKTVVTEAAKTAIWEGRPALSHEMVLAAARKSDFLDDILRSAETAQRPRKKKG